MKKSLIAMAIAGVIAAPMAANAAEAKFFGYSQITAQMGKGKQGNEADGLLFGADRIRLGYKIKQGNAWGKLQFDLNKTDSSNVIGVPEIIKDAVVGYKLDDAANVSAGLFKTPVGMDFNTSGKKLDITKRGMEKKLVLERAAGLMVSGRKIGGGFGYDVGVFNPTDRSSAVKGGEAGKDSAYAARVMYDMDKMLHVEASYGKSAKAAAVDNTQPSGKRGMGEDYSVYDLGAAYKMDAFTVKAEYIAGKNVQGTTDKENVWYLHGGFAINPMTEVVLRHYQASSKPDGGTDTKLGNTYVGANFFLAEKNNARIQLNYVFASGDKGNSAGTTKAYNGIAGGYTDNILLAQFQVGF